MTETEIDPNPKVLTVEERLERIEHAINGLGVNTEWMVQTVQSLFNSFNDMMSQGGPVAMMKAMMGGKKNGRRTTDAESTDE